MNDKLEKTKRLKPAVMTVGIKLKPVASYVYKRRGRFSAAGTAIALYPFLRRPHHTWAEFEKDFRMYDKMNNRNRKTRA